MDVNQIKPVMGLVPGLSLAFFLGFYYFAMKKCSLFMKRTMVKLNLSNSLSFPLGDSSSSNPIQWALPADQ